MSAELDTKQSGDPTTAHHDSEEYESAEEVEEVSYEDGEGEVEEVEVEVEEEVEEDEEVTEGEPADKVVDEDRKNPQFIPKKGYFYEHDDRTNAEEGEEEAEPATVDRPKPKPVVKDTSDKWSHDMFDEEEQAPKTRAELSGRYGYDIRSEDQAPRARRRRRYGRGPNKYTRKWEEEEAYQKPRGGGGYRGRGRGGRNNGGEGRQNSRTEFDEDFPELPASVTQTRKTSEDETRNNRSETSHHPKAEGDGEDDFGRGKAWRGGGRGRPFGNGKERYDSDERGRSGGNRGWNRRNEFSNRNRYPDRRGSGPENENIASVSDEVIKNVRPEKQYDKYAKTENKKTDEIKKDADKTGMPIGKSESNAPFGKSYPNSSNNTMRSTGGTGGTRNPPPFTNTEYKGSESLVANRAQPFNNERTANINRNEFQNENSSHGNYSAADTYQRETRDDRDPRRQTGQTNKGYQGDRRTQVPPRLQHQQILESSHQTAKPKRFSTQRQRQNIDPSMGTSNMGSGPAPVVSSPMGPKLVTASGQGAVPVSAISKYPPSQQGYYENVPSTFAGQVYETGTAGSVTASGNKHGPSVSPSLWVPHTSPYVNAPYPSPPTGPPPPMPQPSYADPSAYMTAGQQAGPPIFAAPHPQFIQEPTIINFVPPVPPPAYGPSFHASGFQGYAQVAPPNPPDFYHGGVTYYSTQNQIPRPHIPVMSKRPKTVLQLVEPPGKKDMMKHYNVTGTRPPTFEAEFSESQTDETTRYDDTENMTTSSISGNSSATTEEAVKEFDLTEQLETMKLQPEPERVKKSPSPAPLDLSPEKSWSEQMADDITPVNSPTEVTGPDYDLLEKQNVEKSNDSKILTADNAEKTEEKTQSKHEES